MSEEGLSYIAKPLKLSTSSVSLWLIHEVKGEYYQLKFINREVKVRVSPAAYDGLLSLIDTDRIVVHIKDGQVRNAVELPQLKLSPWPVLGSVPSLREYELISRSDLIDRLYWTLVNEVSFRRNLGDGKVVEIECWLEVGKEKCGCCSRLLIKDEVWHEESHSMQKNGIRTALAYIYLYTSNLTPSGLFSSKFEGNERIVVKSDQETWSFSTYDVFKNLYALVERLLIERKEVLA